ncbi:MAG: undecaprenyl/decaprenyl-phosphate alpha-N-acetylglucosaminyl 1-phosphate transferase [Deltaproteobacteria bacterium]|nr:undecaprenyl/decaprenyl-phosphate alpha-N-acetylglucosaminyl 1-phosphate transferase [Deltaproteobacteria bacterium]
MFALFALILAFYVTVILVPLTNRLAPLFGAVDQPDGKRKVHRIPTPRTGGIALAGGILVPVWLWVPLTLPFKAFFTGAAIIFILGLLDDLFQLDYKKKFLGQFLGVLAVMVIGKFYVSDLGMWFGYDISLTPWIGIPLTILFLLAGANAINLADGLDGLAGGLCIFIFGCIALLAYGQNEMAIVTCCLVIVGALLGFLRYNTFPATVFMGDTGSQLLGFSAGVLSLYLTQSESSALARTLPLLIVGFPLLDMASVMAERLLEGHSPFLADKRHFHHRLLKMGASHIASVVYIYILQGGMLFLALYLRYYPEEWVCLTYLLIAIPILMVPWISIRSGWKIGRVLNWGEGWADVLGRNTFERLQQGCLAVLSILLSAGLVWLALSSVPRFQSLWEPLLFWLVALAALASYWIRRSMFPTMVRFSLYLLGFYLLFSTQGERLAFLSVSISVYNYVFWGSIAFILAVYLVISRFRDLGVSTLDYLLLLLVALIPFLPMEQIREFHLGTIAGGMIVLLWTTEVILRNGRKYWNLVTLSALISFIIVGIKGISG